METSPDALVGDAGAAVLELGPELFLVVLHMGIGPAGPGSVKAVGCIHPFGGTLTVAEPPEMPAGIV